MSYISSMRETMRGIKMATASLILIWYDWFLIAFIAIPLLLTLLIDLSAYNLLLTREDNNVISFLGLNPLVNEVLRGPHWMHAAMSMLFLFLKVFINTAFMGALVVYSASELKGHIISFARSFARIRNHWIPLTWWVIIITIENIILQNLFSADYQLPMRILIMAFASIWYLASWFVLPLIILQQNGVRRALISSMILVRINFWKVIGGALWLLGLSIIPTLFFDVIDTLADTMGWGPMVIVVILVFLIALKTYILTAETLFKTMLFQEQQRHV